MASLEIPIDENTVSAHTSSPASTEYDVGNHKPVRGDEDIEKQENEAVTAVESPVALAWDGPNDPDNPRNWHFRQKVFQTLPPALFSLVVTLGTSIYTPATDQLERNLHVSFEVAVLPLSVHTLGFALGPIIGAPLSETVGRRWVYIASISLFLIFTMASALAPNIGALLAFRFLAGVFGAPALAVGGGTVPDIWDENKERGIAATFFIMAPFIGSSLGPILGGLISYHRSWRWTIWLTLCIGGPLFLIFAPFLKETYKPVILKKRAIKRGLPIPPKPAGKDALRRLLLITLFRPVRMLLTEPIVTALSIYNAFTFGVLFLFFAAIPYSFGTQYHFDRRDSGAVFTSNVLGCLLGCLVFGIIDKKVYQRRHDEAVAKGGRVAVETRLIGSMVGSFGLPIGLFWFAWTCRTEIHWIVPTLSIIFFAFGMMLIFLSSITYMVDTYQSMAGASALAANGIIRYSFGAAFPLFALQMYKNLGIGMATTVLGIISTVLLFVPFIFYRFGQQFRLKSSYETLRD